MFLETAARLAPLLTTRPSAPCRAVAFRMPQYRMPALVPAGPAFKSTWAPLTRHLPTLPQKSRKREKTPKLPDLPKDREAMPHKHAPRHNANGRWSGIRGDSVWHSQHPHVLMVTQGEGVAFKGGYPDFTPWAEASIRFPDGVLQGTSSDARKADGLWAVQMGCAPEVAHKMRQQRCLVWHHAQDARTMHLLPSLLHANIPHAGGAVLLRHARRATTLPCLQS